jgi:hypothetical protein
VNIAKQEPVKFIKKEIKNGSENYKK